MKKKIIIVISLLTMVLSVVLLIKQDNKSELYKDNLTNDKVIKEENMLSMMLETKAGSGEYKSVTQSNWPTLSDGYLFNAKLSKCENGGEVSWDDENSLVLFAGSSIDKCYVYFDVLPGIDVNFTGSTSTTLKINVTHEDGTISNIYDTYYYSTDGGTTYVSSSDNTYSVDYTSGTISNLSVYASMKSNVKSNILTKKVFNGGQVKINGSTDCSDDVCGYNGVNYISENVNYIFNRSPQYDNLAGYLFNNCTIDGSGNAMIGSGNNDYYMRLVGTNNIYGGLFSDWKNLYINSDGGSLTFGDNTSSVSNVYFALTDSTLSLNGNSFSGVNGTIAFNLFGTVSININYLSIYGDSVLIKVIGDSNVLSGNINSFEDLSSDGLTFLKSLVNNVSFTVTTLSFDFNGFTFTLDEAQTYINSL